MPVVEPSFEIELLYDPNRAVRSGAAYPIRLRLRDGTGANVSSPEIVVTALSVRKISDDTSGIVDTTGNANPDNNFRYDEELEGYIMNLSTTGLTSGTYELVFEASGDSAEHVAGFQVK